MPAVDEADLLFSIKHGEGKDEVIFCRLSVAARVFDHLNELFELEALVAVREARNLAWPMCGLLRGL